jgi:TPR repeat protein
MAAEGNDPQAQTKLGELYENGHPAGVARDDRAAFGWYSKAVEQKHYQAYVPLGQLYLQGRGTTADPAKAVELFKGAARVGFAPAQYILGEMYELGRGVEKNIQWAGEYYKLAADRGNKEAEKKLQTLKTGS